MAESRLRARGFAHFGAGSMDGGMFGLEILAGVLAPVGLLALPRVRQRAGGPYPAEPPVAFGSIMRRLNVSLTGLEAPAGAR